MVRSIDFVGMPKHKTKMWEEERRCWVGGYMRMEEMKKEMNEGMEVGRELWKVWKKRLSFVSVGFSNSKRERGVGHVPQSLSIIDLRCLFW